MVTIRVMTIGDYSKIFDLWTAEHGVPVNPADDSREGIAKYLKRNPSTSFVAECEGKIIGTIMAGHDGRRGFFHHVFVSPLFRGQGIGRKLVDNATAALEKEGINKVALVAFTDNKTGNEFWEKIGFTVRQDLYYRNKLICGSKYSGRL